METNSLKEARRNENGRKTSSNFKLIRFLLLLSYKLVFMSKVFSVKFFALLIFFRLKVFAFSSFPSLIYSRRVLRANRNKN